MSVQQGQRGHRRTGETAVADAVRLDPAMICTPGLQPLDLAALHYLLFHPPATIALRELPGRFRNLGWTAGRDSINEAVERLNRAGFVTFHPIEGEPGAGPLLHAYAAPAHNPHRFCTPPAVHR